MHPLWKPRGRITGSACLPLPEAMNASTTLRSLTTSYKAMQGPYLMLFLHIWVYQHLGISQELALPWASCCQQGPGQKAPCAAAQLLTGSSPRLELLSLTIENGWHCVSVPSPGTAPTLRTIQLNVQKCYYEIISSAEIKIMLYAVTASSSAAA